MMIHPSGAAPDLATRCTRKFSCDMAAARPTSVRVLKENSYKHSHTERTKQLIRE